MTTASSPTIPSRPAQQNPVAIDGRLANASLGSSYGRYRQLSPARCSRLSQCALALLLLVGCKAKKSGASDAAPPAPTPAEVDSTRTVDAGAAPTVMEGSSLTLDPRAEPAKIAGASYEDQPSAPSAVVVITKAATGGPSGYGSLIRTPSPDAILCKPASGYPADWAQWGYSACAWERTTNPAHWVRAYARFEKKTGWFETVLELETNDETSGPCARVEAALLNGKGGILATLTSEEPVCVPGKMPGEHAWLSQIQFRNKIADRRVWRLAEDVFVKIDHHAPDASRSRESDAGSAEALTLSVARLPKR